MNENLKSQEQEFKAHCRVSAAGIGGQAELCRGSWLLSPVFWGLLARVVLCKLPQAEEMTLWGRCFLLLQAWESSFPERDKLASGSKAPGSLLAFVLAHTSESKDEPSPLNKLGR